jgi:hypothetical protein
MSDSQRESRTEFNRVLQLLDEGHPVVALLGWGRDDLWLLGTVPDTLHYVVLTGFNLLSDTMFYTDTDGKECQYGLDDFYQQWNWYSDGIAGGFLTDVLDVPERTILYGVTGGGGAQVPPGRSLQSKQPAPTESEMETTMQAQELVQQTQLFALAWVTGSEMQTNPASVAPSVQSDALRLSAESRRTNWGERSDFAIQQAKDRFFAATTHGRLLEPIGLPGSVEADALGGLLG